VGSRRLLSGLLPAAQTQSRQTPSEQPSCSRALRCKRCNATCSGSQQRNVGGETRHRIKRASAATNSKALFLPPYCGTVRLMTHMPQHGHTACPRWVHTQTHQVAGHSGSPFGRSSF
jgi:hypothetical protein